MLNMDTGSVLMNMANSTFSEGIQVGQAIDAALESSTLTTVFPSSSLGRQLENVAKIIQARNTLGMRRQVFFCETGGFDTHSDQLPRHISILGGVSEAMAAFYNANGMHPKDPRWSAVMSKRFEGMKSRAEVGRFLRTQGLNTHFD